MLLSLPNELVTLVLQNVALHDVPEVVCTCRRISLLRELFLHTLLVARFSRADVSELVMLAAVHGTFGRAQNKYVRGATTLNISLD